MIRGDHKRLGEGLRSPLKKRKIIEGKIFQEKFSDHPHDPTSAVTTPQMFQPVIETCITWQASQGCGNTQLPATVQEMTPRSSWESGKSSLGCGEMR